MSEKKNTTDNRNPVKVTYYFRKPYDFHYSIENIFKEIIPLLPENIEGKIYELPHFSKGVLPRIKNYLAAKKVQGSVNHVTGDIHFIVPGLKKSKTILTIHDLGFMKQSNPINRFILWFFWIWLPVKKAGIITTISDSTKNDIIRYSGCPEEKIQVIPDFINPGFKKTNRPFHKKQPVILMVGTNFNKNIERSLEALSEIPCTLKIIGKLSNSNIQTLRKHSIDYTNLFNLSNDDLIQAYSESDMLVFCSTLEGFGLPILEAQATGRPVVTSNISSMPYVAGDAACFADPFDIISIRKAVQKIIEDDAYREDLIQKGFENIKRFDLHKVTKMYVDLYEEISHATDKHT